MYLAVFLDFVFPTSGGLGDERANRSAVGLGCFDHGVGAMASATRTDPSYRSGATVLEYGLCRDAEKAGHGAEHEPAANCYDNGEINRVYHCDKCVITRPGPSGYTGAMATAHFVAVTAALLAGWMAVRAKGCFNWSDPNARWRLGGFQRFERSAAIELLERLEQMFQRQALCRAR